MVESNNELLLNDTHKVSFEEAISNEMLLYELLNEAYPKEWKSDVTIIKGRKYRGDAVNESRKIVVEIDGGIHPFYMTLKNGQRVKAVSGGHSSASGIERDMAKSNFLAVNGWKLLRYTPESLRKRPFELIRDVRFLCGEDESQRTLCLDRLKQSTISQVQVKISEIGIKV
jgi:very-short-patch-repair endonuclease